MKNLKFLGLLLVMVLSATSFVACSSDDNGNDNNSELASMIVGKWRIIQVEQKDGSMFDVTSSIAETVFEPTYATFISDGTYSGSGYFGNGYGTYKVIGNKVYTYVNGEEYIIYTAESFTSTRATLVMSYKGSTATIRVIVAKQ